MIAQFKSSYMRYLLVVLLSLFTAWGAYAGDSDFPQRPNPPRLVNDMAGMLSSDERDQLEAKLLEYERTSSTQIAVVTVTSIGMYEPSQYGVELFNRWQIGQKGKDNGVLILVSKEEKKINITTGYGLEGALPDAVCGRIIRNEMGPAFKTAHFYEGFVRAADAVIAATKGEYTADEKPEKGGKPGPVAIIILVLIVYLVLWILSKIGGGGGGSYMSGRGHRGFGGGFIGGSIFGSGLGGGRSGGWGGGGGFGGGGFGGFGGGSSGGGGASGGW